MDELTLYYAHSAGDLRLFWRWRGRYMLRDILPNATLIPVTQEDYDWFFSYEYHDHIMKLFNRVPDTLKIVFFRRGGVNIGFAVYVIYHSEDSKCFIVEYNIDKRYRNKGYGSRCFELLRERVMADGAKYIELNLTNESNLRFWSRHGFVKSHVDEYGVDVYVKSPL